MTEAIVGEVRRRRASGNFTRQALLDAAVAIWAEAGLDSVTMNEVALRAGKTRGTVYHHFVDREALLLETRQHLDAVFGALFSDDDHQSLGDPFDVVAGIAADNPDVMRSYLRGMIDEDPHNNPLIARGIRYFQQLDAQGRVRPGIDPQQAALAVFAMWFAATLAVSLEDSLSARRRQAKQFAQTFRHMVYRGFVKPNPGEYAEEN